MKLIYTDNIEQYKANNSNDNIRLFDKGLIDKSFGGIGTLDFKICNIPKTRNRFAHVFWSRPLMKEFKNIRWKVGNQFELTLLLSALSIACLKALGQEVVLYTDTEGQKLLSDLGYDRVYNIFDNLKVNTEFWAAGKIMALQNEPLDSCIVDNDLFVYDGKIINKLNSNDIICSHRESAKVYKPLLEFGQKILPHLQGDASFSSNTGFMKISDFRLKQMFISSYFSSINRLNNPELLSKFKSIGHEAYCADLLCEQFNFHKICKPNYVVDTNKMINSCNVKGFTHLITFEKYLKAPIVLDILKKQFPDYYDIVITTWKKYDFSIEVR